jgi:carbon-monoxide dehydrogenase large subunit
METALDADTPVIHPELGDNLCFTRTLDVGQVDEVFATADILWLKLLLDLADTQGLP